MKALTTLMSGCGFKSQTCTEWLKVPLAKILAKCSIVPRPRPAFCCLQYGSDGKLGGAWEQG